MELKMQTNINELERFNRLMVHREYKIQEMKRKIMDLEEKLAACQMKG